MARENYSCEALLEMLEAKAKNAHDLSRFGAYSQDEPRIGVTMADIRGIARKAAPDLAVAKCLWDKGAYEARLLAVLITPADQASPAMVHKWLAATQSWAICDTIANDLIAKNAALRDHIAPWSREEALYVKRGALAAIACYSDDRRALSADEGERYGKIIWRASDDPRKHIKTAASWALRDMGKIDEANKGRAIILAEAMMQDESKPRQWVGKNALAELKTLIKVPERARLISSSSAMGKRYLAAHPGTAR